VGVTLIFKDKQRRRHGVGVPSKLVRQTSDALGYFVYSEGGMEQEEMDYIVEAQEEKRKNYKRITQPRKIGIKRDKDGYALEVKEV